MSLTRAELAALLDHTLLRAGATTAQFEALCEEARVHGFATVCVPPTRIRHALICLEGQVRICTAIGFPLGASVPAVKASEACLAIADGADELDVVIALGALKDGDRDAVLRDLMTVVAVAEGRPVKAILETALLTEEEIDLACAIAVDAGAASVSTSTGFGPPGGATPEIVARMRRAVGPRIGVKASGGITDALTAKALLAAGADRLGTSASLAILDGWDALQ